VKAKEKKKKERTSPFFIIFSWLVSPPLSPERLLKGITVPSPRKDEWVLPLPGERSLSEKGPSFDS
jgi:hypothetical protein